MRRPLCNAGEARETGLVPGAPPNADGLLGLAPVGAGRIGVYGDSGCLDSSHQRSSCYGMLKAMIAYVATVRRFAAPSQKGRPAPAVLLQPASSGGCGCLSRVGAVVKCEPVPD